MAKIENKELALDFYEGTVTAKALTPYGTSNYERASLRMHIAHAQAIAKGATANELLVSNTIALDRALRVLTRRSHPQPDTSAH